MSHAAASLQLIVALSQALFAPQSTTQIRPAGQLIVWFLHPAVQSMRHLSSLQEVHAAGSVGGHTG